MKTGIMEILLVLVIVTLVSVACSSKFASLPSSMPVAKPMPQPTVVVTALPPPPEPVKIITTREYIYPEQEFIGNSVNVIYFPSKPITEVDIKRYTFICEIWKAKLSSNKELLKNIKPGDNIITLPIYWPLKKVNKTDNCHELIEEYDYSRMQVFAIKNKIEPTKIQLVSQLKECAIVMYLDSIEKQEDLIYAFEVWRKKICIPVIKDTKMYAYTLLLSAKKVLGVLASLITMKS